MAGIANAGKGRFTVSTICVVPEANFLEKRRSKPVAPSFIRA